MHALKAGSSRAPLPIAQLKGPEREVTCLLVQRLGKFARRIQNELAVHQGLRQVVNKVLKALQRWRKASASR